MLRQMTTIIILARGHTVDLVLGSASALEMVQAVSAGVMDAVPWVALVVRATAVRCTECRCIPIRSMIVAFIPYRFTVAASAAVLVVATHVIVIAVD